MMLLAVVEASVLGGGPLAATPSWQPGLSEGQATAVVAVLNRAAKHSDASVWSKVLLVAELAAVEKSALGSLFCVVRPDGFLRQAA